MQKLSLIEHLKCLKAMPSVENKQGSDPQQLLSNKLKALQKARKGGIFENISFCLIYRQGSDEDYRSSFKDMVKGLFHQGAKLVEYNEKMADQYSDFVVISPEEDIEELRKKLSGKLKFDLMVNSNFVADSLKSLTIKDHLKYVLFDNSEEK